MIVIAGKNDIAVHGLYLAMEFFAIEEIIVIVNKNDDGKDSWQRSLLKTALEKGILVRTLEELYDYQINFFFSLEFDQILNPKKLSTNKVYNIHFSELPRYKGMHTSVWPILNADNHSGVTLHEIDYGIDTGGIIAQSTFKLSKSDRSQDCYRKYISNAQSLLTDWFSKIIEGDIELTKQSAINSTYYSKRSIDYTKLDIDFDQTAWQIQRQLYAFSFRPYQLLRFNNNKISDVIIKDSKSLLKPGTIISQSDDSFILSTIDYDVELYIDRLDYILEQIPTMSVETFSSSLVKTLGVNDRNDKGWSPIIVASYYGRKDLITYLLNKGANINDRNYRGTTVLMYAKDYAVKNNDCDFFDFIIQQGADIRLRDWSDKSLLDYITNEEANFLGIAL